MQTIRLNIQLIVKHQAQCNCVTNNLFRQHAIDAKRKTETASGNRGAAPSF